MSGPTWVKHNYHPSYSSNLPCLNPWKRDKSLKHKPYHWVIHCKNNSLLPAWNVACCSQATIQNPSVWIYIFWHSNGAVCTVNVQWSLVESLMEVVYSKATRLLGISACQLQVVEYFSPSDSSLYFEIEKLLSIKY